MKPPVSQVYCTYFDSAYLARGIAMVESLRRHDPGCRIVVLALDELCARVLLKRFADTLQIIEPAVLHAREPRLLDARRQRSAWAYYATQKPSLAMFTMESGLRPESVMYIDADTWFFGDPQPMFDEIGARSVGVFANRFHSGTLHLGIFGLYCGGCVYWRDDETGRRCLAEWRDDCLDWCGEQPQPDGRFMNQGYLNRWPDRYAGVAVVRHPGCNLAPWNVDGHILSLESGKLRVGGRPLIFYHFSGLNRDSAGGWFSYHPHLEKQGGLAREWIYQPYLAALETESRRLQEEVGIDGLGTVHHPSMLRVAVRFPR